MRATCRSDVYERAPPGTYAKAVRGNAPQFQPVSMAGIWHLNEATGDVAFCARCPGNYTCVDAKLIQNPSAGRLELPERWRWRVQELVGAMML